MLLLVYTNIYNKTIFPREAAENYAKNIFVTFKPSSITSIDKH